MMDAGVTWQAWGSGCTWLFRDYWMVDPWRAWGVVRFDGVRRAIYMAGVGVAVGGGADVDSPGRCGESRAEPAFRVAGVGNGHGGSLEKNGARRVR